MNLLEEIKRQAAKQQLDLEQAGQDDTGMHHLRCLKTAAALREIHQYLHELTELLNGLDTDILTDITVGNLAKLLQLRQSEYRLYSESTYQREVVRLIFTLQNETSLELDVTESPEIEKQIDQLKRQGVIISYLSRTPLKLTLQSYIPAAIEFYSDFAESNIHVLLQNFHELADLNFMINSEHVDEAFLDKLGRFLLRRDNSFLEQLSVDTNVSGTYRSGQHAVNQAHPQTEEMEASRLRSLFNREHHLYLTYHNNIKDLNRRTARFVLGRATDCDLVVDSDMASRHHAEIVFRKGKFVLLDQSTNGTFVKPQGGKEVYVQAEEVPLTGSGFISLGKSITVDNENLIYYSCQ